MTGANFSIKSERELLSARGLETGGSVQRYVDSEVLRLTAPYIPFKTGNLIRSGTLGTVVGSGTVQYVAPYAKRQYYRKGKIGSRTEPLRGPLWFERMKIDHKAEILAGAKKRTGGK